MIATLAAIAFALLAQAPPSPSSRIATCNATPPKLLHQPSYDNLNNIPRALSGEGVLIISVNRHGKPTHVAVKVPSGSAAYDREMVRLAWSSTYKAATRNCLTVSGVLTYDYGWTIDIRRRVTSLPPSPLPPQSPSPAPSPKTTTCPPTQVHRITTYGPVPSSTPPSRLTPDDAILMLVINSDGSIRSVSIEVSTGDLQKDKLAIHEAKSYRYEPATINCHPVDSVYRLLVRMATVN
jgi:hypothetical protein